MLLAATALVQAANVPTYSVKVYKDDSVRLAPGVLKITSVKDLRVLGKNNVRLLGSTAVGVFQERMVLWSSDPVDLSVENLLKRWFPAAEPVKTESVKLAVVPDSAKGLVKDSTVKALADTTRKDTAKALPMASVRVEILSFETWSVPTTNPAKARAKVRLRILADEENWQGKIAEVEAGADRDGLNTPEDQAELLRLSLRKAMLAFLDQDWRRAQPLESKGEPGPEPDVWTDALKRATDKPSAATRTLAHLDLTWGVAGFGFSGRGAVYYEPEEDWNKEYWAALRLRDPRLDGAKQTEAWVGEVGGGLGWQRRLGANESPWVLVNAAGGLLGVERFTEISKTGKGREGGVYVGIEGRSGGRYEPAGTPGISGEAGLQAALRFPSSIQTFDIGFYLDAGWRF
ncbi:MAG: hypothetical protein RL318_149 [Fibrobacterota bacterium]|jgi:hypothetical protein